MNEKYKNKYDFFYLPMDFQVYFLYLQKKCNMGYAFINIIDRKDILSFFKDFNNQKWKLFKSGKVYFS